jgi:hypothetical protein
MSGRAPRTAGSDHVGFAVFSASVPGRGVLCQGAAGVPEGAAHVQLLIGTYGHPVPDLRIEFLTAAGVVLAAGHLAPGAREGVVSIPLTSLRRGIASSSCLHVGGSSGVVLGGEGGPVTPSSEVINGKPQPGRIGLLYFRPGSESWWQLLPVLSHRFGLGKASFLGDWSLPVAALLLLSAWVGAVRLLARELT